MESTARTADTGESGTAFIPFDADAGLILATRLPGEEADFARRAGLDAIERPTDGAPLWVHLDRTRPAAQAWMRERSGVDNVAVDALLADETRPRYQRIGDGMLLILRGVDMQEGAELDDLITIRLWIEPTVVISLRATRFRTIAALRERAQRGTAPATPGALVAAIATGLAERLGAGMSQLEEDVAEIEEAMLADATPAGATQGLAEARRQAIRLRRFLVPQRDTLVALAGDPSTLLDDADRLRIRVAAEQVGRIVDALEDVRDRAAVNQEEIRANHDRATGRTVYLLTLVATIALPLGILTGLLGINVGGIPLSDSPWGFAIVCGMLVAIGIGEFLLFRKLRMI